MGEALQQAINHCFEVLDGKVQRVAEGHVEGEDVSLMPGAYGARLNGGAAPKAQATLHPNDLTSVAF